MFMNDHDRNQLEEIYSCYKRDLFITAYSILKDSTESEDVVHNAILKISKNLEKIQDVKCKKTRSYMVIIVRNLCYDIYNKKKHMQFIPFDEMREIASEDQMDMDDYIVNIEKSNEIAKQLEKLHPSYADILTLRYYHELSISEIAHVLNILEDNVSVRLHRALNAYKRIIDKRGEELEESIKR